MTAMWSSSWTSCGSNTGGGGGAGRGGQFLHKPELGWGTAAVSPHAHMAAAAHAAIRDQPATRCPLRLAGGPTCRNTGRFCSRRVARKPSFSNCSSCWPCLTWVAHTPTMPSTVMQPSRITARRHGVQICELSCGGCAGRSGGVAGSPPTSSHGAHGGVAARKRRVQHIWQSSIHGCSPLRQHRSVCCRVLLRRAGPARRHRGACELGAGK